MIVISVICWRFVVVLGFCLRSIFLPLSRSTNMEAAARKLWMNVLTAFWVHCCSGWNVELWDNIWGIIGKTQTSLTLCDCAAWNTDIRGRIISKLHRVSGNSPVWVGLEKPTEAGLLTLFQTLVGFLMRFYFLNPEGCKSDTELWQRSVDLGAPFI